QIVADQQRRDADADRSDFAIAEQQRLAVLEVLPLARVDRAQLRERRLREQLGEVAAGRQRLPFERAIAVQDGEAVDVDQRGVGDVLRVAEARLENRSEPGIG